MPKIVGGGNPFPPEICVQSDRPTFQTAQFRPISAHSASNVIASEKSSISTYSKSTTRFPTSHRWTVYVTPKGGTKTRYRWCASKMQLLSKKVCYKVSCMKTSSSNVVATSFPYPTVHWSTADDVPIYLKFAFELTHPFRKRRFPKLSFKSAIGLAIGAFWSCFSPHDTMAIHWHPQKILRRSSQGNPSVGGFKRRG